MRHAGPKRIGDCDAGISGWPARRSPLAPNRDFEPSWADKLDRNSMPEPEPEVLAAILDYLGRRLSADTPR